MSRLVVCQVAGDPGAQLDQHSGISSETYSDRKAQMTQNPCVGGAITPSNRTWEPQPSQRNSTHGADTNTAPLLDQRKRVAETKAVLAAVKLCND
jgi:hypothetical protein